MNEHRTPNKSSIPFPNGWVASIVTLDYGFSVAVCDYNGYFDWNILNQFGAYKGTIDCKDEDEVCKALSIIEALKSIR
jgi:hypothetical protein